MRSVTKAAAEYLRVRAVRVVQRLVVARDFDLYESEASNSREILYRCLCHFVWQTGDLWSVECHAPASGVSGRSLLAHLQLHLSRPSLTSQRLSKHLGGQPAAQLRMRLLRTKASSAVSAQLTRGPCWGAMAYHAGVHRLLRGVTRPPPRARRCWQRSEALWPDTPRLRSRTLPR